MLMNQENNYIANLELFINRFVQGTPSSCRMPALFSLEGKEEEDTTCKLPDTVHGMYRSSGMLDSMRARH